MHLKNILKTLSASFYLKMAVCWTFLTLYLSLISARVVSKFNVWDIIGMDKAAHFIFYTVFSFLWSMGLRTKEMNKNFALFFSVSFGVLMEICQFYLFNGRSFEFFDILANIAGSVTGVILFNKIIN